MMDATEVNTPGLSRDQSIILDETQITLLGISPLYFKAASAGFAKQKSILWFANFAVNFPSLVLLALFIDGFN